MLSSTENPAEKERRGRRLHNVVAMKKRKRSSSASKRTSTRCATVVVGQSNDSSPQLPGYQRLLRGNDVHLLAMMNGEDNKYSCKEKVKI